MVSVQLLRFIKLTQITFVSLQTTSFACSRGLHVILQLFLLLMLYKRFFHSKIKTFEYFLLL